MEKIIYLLIISVISVVLYSCQQEYVEPNHFSDIMFFSSTGGQNASLNSVVVGPQGFYLTLLDLSQGAISHQWSITGQDGLKFLSTGFTAAAADTLGRQQHIKLDSIETDRTANIFFQKEGIYTVTLKNVFKDSLGYMTTPSVYDPVAHNWVFKKVIYIQVFGPLIPVATIMKNMTEPIASTIDTIRLAVGDNLTFSDTSKGQPTTITWNITGGSPSSDMNLVFTTTFNTAGIFKNSTHVLTRDGGNTVSLTSTATGKLPVIKVQ